MNELIDAPLPSEVATNPLMLLEKAVERGMDPAQLKALVDLHEQWQASRAREAFNSAMKECQAELPLIVKDAENSQTKSRYAKMEYIQVIAKPVITKHGFALSFAEEDCPTPEWKRTICDVRHSGGHCVRYHLDLPLDGVGAKGNAIGAMNRVQAAVSTGTYAQRYLIARIFNLTIADTDLDGRPPANENPTMRPGAPLAPSRAQRKAPAPKPEPHPNRDKVSEIMLEWKRMTLAAGESTEGTRFWTWFRKVTGSVDNPARPDDWSESELSACRKALGLEVPA